MSIVFIVYKAFKHYIAKQEAKANKKKLLKVGNDVVISNDCKILGGQYIEIGDGSYIGPGTRLEAWDHYLEDSFQPQIKLERNVRINSRAHIGAINRVTIGEGTLLGSNVFITDHSHGKTDELSDMPTSRKLYSKGEVIIGKNCWLCENVVVLPNVRIGEGSVVGAGTVVTHDIPPYSIVVGSGARIVRTGNVSQ